MSDFITALFSNIWSTFLVVLFFGGSIFVHELGHFLAARRRGVHVARFSIGFGPKIFSWKGRDGVEYRVSWLPLGGYVALPQLADMRDIEGDSGTNIEKLPPVSYTSKLIVFVAGAIFNVLFAFVLACVLWVIGQPQSNDVATTRIGYVASTVELPDGSKVPSPASQAGIQVGDEIRSIDGTPVHNWTDLMQAVIMGSGRSADGRPRSEFTVERGGKIVDLTLFPRLAGDDGVRRVGVSPDYELLVQDVPADTIGAKAGFLKDDEIISVGGQPMRNISSYYDFLASHRGAIPAVVQRDGKQLTLAIPARPEAANGTGLGMMITTGYKIVHASPLGEIQEQVVTTFRTLWSLINPRSDIGLSKVSGPVGIVHIFYDAAGAGIRAVLWFTILININLAIFNLLPIPVLDGGHVLFATIARLRGRPLPPQFVMSAQSVFIVLLFTMILYVSFFDVRRWSREARTSAAPPDTSEAPAAPPAAAVE